jgi:hypothetical protein
VCVCESVCESEREREREIVARLSFVLVVLMDEVHGLQGTCDLLKLKKYCEAYCCCLVTLMACPMPVPKFCLIIS